MNKYLSERNPRLNSSTKNLNLSAYKTLHQLPISINGSVNPYLNKTIVDLKMGSSMGSSPHTRNDDLI